MADRWFYAHEGQTHGPLTTDEIKRRAAARLLLPDDLLWPEGMDQGQAVEAASAIDFAVLGAASPPAPDWLSDVKKAEELASQRPAPATTVLPDWMKDAGHILREPAAKSSKLPDWLSDVWQAVQAAAAKPPQAVTPLPSQPAQPTADPFVKASIELADWVDAKKNRPLILSGSADAIWQDPSIQDLMNRHRAHGQEMVYRLWEHLGFLVYNRRKFYQKVR